MSPLQERIDFLISQRPYLEKWVGSYDRESLIRWVDQELGNHRRFGEWIEGSKVEALSPVLHVVSSNTPHAAFQSVFRALLMGCHNWVKIPSVGLPQFEAWAARIPQIEMLRDLPSHWCSPAVAVLYGTADTMEFFQNYLKTGTRIIPHGPKLSAAFIFSDEEGLTHRLADDILSFRQRGCLSVRAIYYQGDASVFCDNLAVAMEQATHRFPQNDLDISEAGAVRNARELARFQIANGADMKLWESMYSTDWTILYNRETSILSSGPGGGFVTILPMPLQVNYQALGDELRYLSTAVLEPMSCLDRLESISPPRICAAGNVQKPGIFWHPDGEMPLAGLVLWRDLG